MLCLLTPRVFAHHQTARQADRANRNKAVLEEERKLVSPALEQNPQLVGAILGGGEKGGEKLLVEAVKLEEGKKERKGKEKERTTNVEVHTWKKKKKASEK